MFRKRHKGATTSFFEPHRLPYALWGISYVFFQFWYIFRSDLLEAILKAVFLVQRPKSFKPPYLKITFSTYVWNRQDTAEMKSHYAYDLNTEILIWNMIAVFSRVQEIPWTGERYWDTCQHASSIDRREYWPLASWDTWLKCDRWITWANTFASSYDMRRMVLKFFDNICLAVLGITVCLIVEDERAGDISSSNLGFRSATWGHFSKFSKSKVVEDFKRLFTSQFF